MGEIGLRVLEYINGIMGAIGLSRNRWLRRATGKVRPSQCMEKSLGRNRMPSGGIFLNQNRAVCQLNTVKHELKTKP